MNDFIIIGCIYAIFRLAALFCEKELKIKDPLFYFVIGAVAMWCMIRFTGE